MNEEKLIQAGVDVKDLLNRLMNNMGLMKLVIGKFVADNTFQTLADAVAAGDLKAAEFACHSLKGMCGNLSLKKLFADFQEQLRLLRTGDQANAVAMMEHITPEYENALRYLKLWLTEQ